MQAIELGLLEVAEKTLRDQITMDWTRYVDYSKEGQSAQAQLSNY